MKRSTFSIKRRSAGPLWARTRQIPFASARFLHEGCKACVRPLRFFDDLAIAKKLLVMVLFTGLLPLALFFAISLKDTSQTLTAEIQARGEHFASMTAQRIDDYFLARRTDAEILAASDIAVEGLAAHNTFSLTPLQKDALATRFDAFFSIPAEKHGFTDVFLTNQYGEIAYSMNYNPLDLAPLVFDGAFTEAAMAGQTHWTEVFRNSLIDDNLILVATPVYSRSGHVQGTLNIVLNQAKLDAIVTGGLDTHGTSARAYLIDDRGRLLTRLPQSYGLSTLEPLPAAPALDDLVASLQQGADTLATSTRTYRSFDNRSVAGTLSTVHLGDRPTGLVIEVTAKEAYGALSAFQKKASLLVVSLFCLSIPLALVIARSIGKPLQKATATAADLAKYHVHPQGTAPSRRDEIGDLQRAMEAIGVHMVTLIDDLQRTAKALKGASSHLTKGSEKSALSAEEATRALEKISRDSHLQAQDAAHSADQTQKLAEILRSQNTALANLSEATGRVHRVIGDGRSIAHQLVAHHRISQVASQTIADQIAQSHESAEKIQGASALIRAIADQTNLLSLNASIEAARAGKEGAGFAVVAGEIKKLADEAKGSTDEIDRRLRTLQKDTREMKNSLAKLLHASEQQAESVMRTETVFATIEEAMGHSGDRLHALEKTSQAVEESRFAVAQDMAHLSQLTQQTSHRTAGITAAMQQQTATAVEISSASERLDDLATYLDDLIAQFTIEGGRPAKR